MALMDGILVIGTGGHARFVVSILQDLKLPIRGLITSEHTYDSRENILGLSIIGVENDLNDFYAHGSRNLSLAVGNNNSRKILYEKWHKFGYSFSVIIHPSAVIATSASIESGCIIGPNVVIGANVTVGKNCIINSSAVIEHETLIGSHCHVAPGAVVCGRVVIGDEVMLGANSTVIDKLIIPSKTILGAGSTLLHSPIEKGGILVGSPAKQI
jgi:sugar O-acyltransferase (sialic acid O-acetyltransferase NeuD family)